MYSLWRAGKLLGRLSEKGPLTHHGQRVGSLGILVPADALLELSPMMQTRSPILPDHPVFQHPLEPVVFGKPAPKNRGSSGPVAFRALNEEAARGVAADQVLEMRDETGTPVDTAMIMLQLYKSPNGFDARARSEWGLAADAREYWFLSFAAPEHY